MKFINLETVSENEPSTHTDFLYPEEEEGPEELDNRSKEFIVRFLSLLFASENIRLTLVAYCIAAGIDLTFLMGTNIESQLAKQLGVSRQTLDTTVKRICKEHGIKKRIIKHEKQTNKYKSLL